VKAARLWPLALTAVLAITVAANFWLLWAANDDQHLAFEPDYYRKALAWDSIMAQGGRNLALSWQATAQLDRAGRLAVSLADREGLPLAGARVTAEVIPIAHADRMRSLSMTEGAAGQFGAALSLVYSGLHEIRLVALYRGDRFTAVLRGMPGTELTP
jgi:nitrogen fixation protein FixH